MKTTKNCFDVNAPWGLTKIYEKLMDCSLKCDYDIWGGADIRFLNFINLENKQKLLACIHRSK